MLTKQTHKKCVVQVGESALLEILTTILDSHEPTRREVAELSGYSEVTVGKIMQGIFALGLADKTIKKPKDNGRVCAHLSHTDNLHFLIIDVSSREFTMSLVTSAQKVLRHYSYIYSDSLRFEDNLIIFLDSGIKRLGGEDASFSACAVIMENPNRACRKQTGGVMPARAFDNTLIKEKVTEILGHSPDMTVSPDVCIKQYLIDTYRPESAYIMIGRTLSACYLSRAKNLTVCKPWDMIIDGMPLSKYVGGATQPSVIYTAAAKLTNMLDCAFSPNKIVIQSDSLALGRDFPAEIKNYLSSMYASAAHIEVCDSPYPVQLSGATALLRNKLFKKHIISFESMKD